MYELRIYKKAEKEIKKISKLHQNALIEALSELKENPLLGKPLTEELSGRFTYKIGHYRIIYKVEQKSKVVHVITAGHRSIIYR